MTNQPLVTCLCFRNQAEEAAKFYTSVFKNSKMGATTYYPKEGFEVHKQPEGTVLTVAFTINGQEFVALNGPDFKFTEAISFQVWCDTQEEIDYYWKKFTENGGEESVCGWCKDRFGVSWQVAPSIMPRLLADPKTAGKAMMAFMPMKKFELAKILAAVS